MIMNVLFLGTLGIYHPLIAAYLYLGQLKTDDISNLKFWGDRISEARGDPLLVGYDQQGNGVYSLGAGVDVIMTQKSIEQMVKIFDRSEKDLIVQTVFIKHERILLFLHRAGRFKAVNRLIAPLIKYLLNQELIAIQQQVENFRDKVRFD